MAIFVSNGPVFYNYGSKLSKSGQNFGPSVGWGFFFTQCLSVIRVQLVFVFLF